MIKKIVVFTFCLCFFISVKAELCFYVSSKGSDKAKGTIEAPFRTLEKARNTIRNLSKADRRQNIRVLIRGGFYKIDKTFVLNVQDGAPLGLNVSYEAYPNEKPIFDSSVAITGWKLAKELPNGTPDIAKGNLYVANMPDGLNRFYSLFDGNNFIKRSEIPYKSCPKLPREMNGVITRWRERDTLHFVSGPFKKWHNINDIEIYLKPTRNWVSNYLSLKSVDLKNNVAITTENGTYKLSGNSNKNKSGNIEKQFSSDGFLCNVPAGLNKPGRWIVDTYERKVYLWPSSKEQLKHRIVAPSLEEYIRMEGKNDEWGDNDKPIIGIKIKGLTLQHGKRFAFHKGCKGVQHDWEMYDEGNAYIRLRGAEHCVITDCSLINGANSGIRLDLYCQNNTIENNLLNNIGYTGIFLCGYGPGTKDVNKNNIITNNEIGNIGVLWFHGLGIFVFQSGFNNINHNYIHETNYDAIVISGVRPRFFGYRFRSYPNFPKVFPHLREIMSIMRWKEIGGKPSTFRGCQDYAHSRGNIVEYNEISAAMFGGGDGNALYLSGTWGNMFRYNFVYATPAPPGIFRNDDEQYESVCYGNIFVGLSTKDFYGVTLKHQNNFENNIVYNWGEKAIKDATWINETYEKDSPGTKVSHNIFASPNDNCDFSKYTNHYGDNNDYYAAKNIEGSKLWLKKRQTTGNDLNSMVSRPLFTDLQNLDFTLLPNSPVLKSGFIQIPFQSIGLYNKPAVVRLREEGLTMDSLLNGRYK